jgi:hypothetical protein
MLQFGRRNEQHQHQLALQPGAAVIEGGYIEGGEHMGVCMLRSSRKGERYEPVMVVGLMAARYILCTSDSDSNDHLPLERTAATGLTNYSSSVLPAVPFWPAGPAIAGLAV